MSGSNIRVIDLPDLGAVTDASSFVIDKAAATGRFSALALKTYCSVTTLPEAPSNNTPYGRMNGAWTPVLGDAPSNSLPYARMNATWSPVVPEAPLTGTIYGRGSAGWSPVLAITGGTISGNAGVVGNFTSGGNLYSQNLQLSAANSYQWQFFVQAGSADQVQQHHPSYSDVWAAADGMRKWNGPTGLQMSLDAGGTLSVTGNINGGSAGSSISVPGNITGGTAIWNVAGAFGFAPGGLGRKFLYGAAYYWEWDNTSVGANLGMLSWVSNGTSMWHMRATDSFCFNSVGAVGGVGPYVVSSDRRGKTGIAPTTKGLAEILQLQPVSFTRGDPTTGAQEQIGFVAQDVQPIVPEAVWTTGIPLRDGSGGMDSAEPTLGLSESTIAAVSVNAIKELNDIITALTARIAALENPA